MGNPIKENPKITAKQLAKIMSISSRSIEKHIANLKKQGSLKRIGPDKGGYWEITGS